MGLEGIEGVYTPEPLTTWDSVLQAKKKYGFGTDNWLFRGHRDASWELESTFERAKDGCPDQGRAIWEYEAAILREFTRRAHHFITDFPPMEDTLEWFALMRHYGAACRLLDFTYSFYVACYFALKESSRKDEFVAVWAVNTDWLIRRFSDRFGEDIMEERQHDFRFKRPSDFRKHFLSIENPKQFVGPVNPYRLNQRLTAQQGVFLCPGDIRYSFMKNLLIPPVKAAKNQVLRLVISHEVKTEALRDLHRMNINSATLFPDLAGYAQSLADWFHLAFLFVEKDLRLAIEGKTPLSDDSPE